MIARPFYLEKLAEAVRRSPVTALFGPRQSGKTTLARLFRKNRSSEYLDLESQPDLRRLENPELFLGSLQGLVILDEIQVKPELFQTLRVLADRPKNRTRILILGSASPVIIRQASETLAGRVAFVELAPLDLQETGRTSAERLWLRGGFPRSFLARSNKESMNWRENFIRTFLERDLAQLGITIPSTAMRRFWTMLAHFHGQTWNASELARSMGLSDKTVRSYLDILAGTYMIRQLQPWHQNIGKRQVKSPKIYFRDSGLLHCLLTLPDSHSLLGHPRVGASWEGFALEQVLQTVRPAEAFFWATQGGAELDLLFFLRGNAYGVEMKFQEAPRITKSMRTALVDLKLKHLWMLYPGSHIFPMDQQITAWPLGRVSQLPFTADPKSPR